MSCSNTARFVVCVSLVLLVAAPAPGKEQPAYLTKTYSNSLILVCEEGNDLFRSLVAGEHPPRRSNEPGEAISSAMPNSTVLILAVGYPDKRTNVEVAHLAKAKAKKVRLYIEYPESIPGLTFEAPRTARWERAIVTDHSPFQGLAPLRLLALHECRFLPTSADKPCLVLGRVAGFDTAAFGMPKETFPILFTTTDGNWIATTKLSNFTTARYALIADWLTFWKDLLATLDPAGSPHNLVAQPRVRPAFGKDEKLPVDAELAALGRCADWYKQSRLLISPEREPQIHELLRSNQTVAPPPAASDPVGDGSRGILEGYTSQILPDGSQLQSIAIRADCQAETAAALALHAKLAHDVESERIARNLLKYLYFDSELHGRERGNPKHPAYGLIAWGAIAPSWQVANYGDDNARTLLATMAAAAILNSDEWDEPMLEALYANLRTTGKLGFRGDRIDMPPLESHGWKAYEDGEVVNLSPSFEAYSWACYLWAFARTGDRAFLDKTKTGIRKTMEAYPDGWRWGDNLDRSRMLLALAWLIRVEDTPEHRLWLKRISDDLLSNQQPCGAIPEVLSGASTGHFLAPTSNEAYGTSETPLIQEDGDPVSDQLYTTNFTLIGLREAVAATNDPQLKRAEDKLAEYVVRIQVRSESLPYLSGTWFRAFDFERWDYWASSGDAGWGAWCAETGWGPAWNAISLALRVRNTSLWELTQSSNISSRVMRVRAQMSRNDGSPWAIPESAGN